MANLQTLFSNHLKRYRNKWDYVAQSVNEMDGTRKNEAEKRIADYFDSCSKIEMLPEASDCLDIINELKEIA